MLGLRVGAVFARLLLWLLYFVVAVLHLLVWVSVVTGVVMFIAICLLSAKISEKVQDAKTRR